MHKVENRYVKNGRLVPVHTIKVHGGKP